MCQQKLSEVALKYGIGLHVDCCLGGFILPFARMLTGSDIPPFDFKCPGVTSMSAVSLFAFILDCLVVHF
jgi:glutamate/tyrosine decarboxylase-like PLP-dependent enzyme